MRTPFGQALQEGSETKATVMATVLAVVLGIGLVAFGPAPEPSATTVEANGTQTVSLEYPMAVHAQVSATATGCENAPGPWVTLNGGLTLGGLGVRLLFKNNLKGTHTYTTSSTVDVVVVPEGGSVKIPKQPVQGGVGGNPFVFLQFVDEQGAGLTSEYFLGRCVQGLSKVSADFVLPTMATAKIGGGSCSNQGSTITLSGELRLSGLNARLIFRNNDNPVGGPHAYGTDAIVDIVVIPSGQAIEFAKQPPLGGAGGNPWIFLQFLNSQGLPVGNEFLIGRCVQLS